MTVKQIACCTDFSENAEDAFKTAVELAEKHGAKLYILHVLPPRMDYVIASSEWVVHEPPGKSLILDLEERMQKDYGAKISGKVEYEIIILEGHISTEIINFLKEKEIGLVVLGSYGLSGMGLVFFGSVARRIANKAPCSVMIVRK